MTYLKCKKMKKFLKVVIPKDIERKSKIKISPQNLWCIKSLSNNKHYRKLAQIAADLGGNWK